MPDVIGGIGMEFLPMRHAELPGSFRHEPSESSRVGIQRTVAQRGGGETRHLICGGPLFHKRRLAPVSPTLLVSPFLLVFSNRLASHLLPGGLVADIFGMFFVC